MGGSRVAYRVFLEPSSSGYLFLLNRIIALQGNFIVLTKDVSDDSILTRPHPYQRLSYRGTSLLGSTPSAKLSSEAQLPYLQLPQILSSRIPDLAKRIVGRSNNAAQSAERISEYLRTHFEYSLDPAQLRTPQPLTTFLFETKKGHCEYFASSMVVLLRSLQVPARVVNGFQSGEYNQLTGTWVIRGRDAHSWVEAWMPSQGWESFDPTPSSSRPSDNSFFTSLTYSLENLETFWAEWILGYDDDVRFSLVEGLREKSRQVAARCVAIFWKTTQRVFLEIHRFARSSFHSPSWVWPSIFIFAIAFPWILVRSMKIRRRRVDRSEIQFYDECLSLLASRGAPKPIHMTPSEYAANFGATPVAKQIAELTSLYNLIRFGDEPIQNLQLRRARELLREIRASLNLISGGICLNQ